MGNPPTTAWARKLDQVMRERDWSKVRLFEEIGPELGYRPKSRTAIYPILTDREPSEREAAVLERHFGRPDPLPETPAPVGTEQLVAQMARMLEATVQALTDVRLELADARRSADEQRRETAELIGALSAQLAELRDLAGTPAGSAGRA